MVDGLPVDASLTPVSRSNPAPGARGALDACGITNFTPDTPGNAIEFLDALDQVAGMALLPSARRANDFAPFGPAPELKTDDPVWIIQMGGWITFSGDKLESPTCVVVPGKWGGPLWFVTGRSTRDGVVRTPWPGPSPIFRLPPMTP